MSLYLDACVLVPLFTDEAASTDVRDFVTSVTTEMLVSDLAIAEFSAAISHHVRSGRTSDDIARNVLSLFDRWVAAETIHAHFLPIDFQRARSLVRRFDLKLLTPDALHLALCERQGWTLGTLDARLQVAATAIGVAVETV